jgi:hypothetical protein
MHMHVNTVTFGMLSCYILFLYLFIYLTWVFSFSLNDSSIHDAVSATMKVLGELPTVAWPDSDEAQRLEMSTFLARTGWHLKGSSCLFHVVIFTDARQLFWVKNCIYVHEHDRYDWLTLHCRFSRSRWLYRWDTHCSSNKRSCLL